MMLSIDEVRSLEGLCALKSEWAGLWKRCPSSTPFQSPWWLLPWCGHFSGRNLRVFVIRSEGRVACIAPLYCHTGEDGARGLHIAGNGISDYLDIIAEPGSEGACVRLLFDTLLDDKGSWDICDFQELRPSSPLLSVYMPEGVFRRAFQMDACPVIDLPGSSGDFYSGFSTRSRKRLRYLRNSLKRPGVSIEAANKDTLKEYLDSLFKLHCSRWEEKGQTGVLSNERLRSFNSRVAEGFLEEGLLRLYRMRLDGTDASALYSFVWAGRKYFYLCGFNPELRRSSPGRSIVLHAIEEAIREGLSEADLLRGREDHKYRWGARDRLNYRLTITHSKGV